MATVPRVGTDRIKRSPNNQARHKNPGFLGFPDSVFGSPVFLWCRAFVLGSGLGMVVYHIIWHMAIFPGRN